jgi:hypothetical protein
MSAHFTLEDTSTSQRHQIENESNARQSQAVQLRTLTTSRLKWHKDMPRFVASESKLTCIMV